jgi:hypothetical protein
VLVFALWREEKKKKRRKKKKKGEITLWQSQGQLAATVPGLL